ncbi:MAG: YqaE/Pmp3 family membrane protein [Chitinophagaceae bacterium]|nr:YqaE/Pmp3 family membrane protein [Chitinophagaceae bacterium]
MPLSSLPASKPDSATVQYAIDEFRSLTSKEKKARFKEVKNEIKNFKKAKKAGKEADTNTLLLVILAILLPPLAVYLYEGEINNRFWISLLLTVLGWLPGIIYAMVLILGKY